jgi:cytochrome P450 family 4
MNRISHVKMRLLSNNAFDLFALLLVRPPDLVSQTSSRPTKAFLVGHSTILHPSFLFHGMIMFEKKSPIEGVPVIPGGSFVTGHLSLLKEPNFQVALHKWSVEHADEQGRVTFWMGPTTPCLSVTHPKDVQTLLKATSHRELFPIMGRLMEIFFGKYNLATLTGKEWKSKRAIIVKALHGHNLVEANQRAFQKASETLVRRLETENSVDDIHHILQMLTLDAFGLAVLHTDFQCCKNLKPSSIGQDLEFLAQEMMRRMIVSPWDPSNYFCNLPTSSNKMLQEANTRIATFIEDLIQTQKQQLIGEDGQDYKHDDLLSNLLLASKGEDDKVSTEDIANIVKSLLFAGFETTSTALAFALYLLAKDPRVEEECAKEIQQQHHSGSNDDYPYLHAVVTETLRLYPPAISTTRSLDRDFELQPNNWASGSDAEKDDTATMGTIPVPKGTYLYFPIWIIQRSEKNFSDPTVFRPERWLEPSTNTQSPYKSRESTEFVIFYRFYYLQFDSYATVSATSFSQHRFSY